ncbi:MAG: SIR2 family protein, partial [Defluviicoccus sp.]
MGDGFPYGLVAPRLLLGNVVPFLGAAASMYHRSRPGDGNAPPPGAELSEALAVLAGYSGEDDPDDYPCRVTTCCKRSKRFLQLIQKQRQDLPRIASIVEHVKGDWEALKDCLIEQFSRSFTLNNLYLLLAEIAKKRHLLIITTNYDDMLERAFDQETVPYHWVSTFLGVPDKPINIRYRCPGSDTISAITPSKLDIDLDANSIIYKIHGSIDRTHLQEHSFLITEENYVTFLKEFRKRVVPPRIGRMLEQKSFLFLGYSLRDWNFRVMLESIRQHRFEHWAVLRNISEIDKALWRKKGIKPFDLDLNDFVSGMQE